MSGVLGIGLHSGRSSERDQVRAIKPFAWSFKVGSWRLSLVENQMKGPR